jgi:hypothetical protein
MGIDCETVVGYGVLVDTNEFLRFLGLDEDELEYIYEADTEERVAEYAKQYGTKIAFKINSYDELNTVFI